MNSKFVWINHHDDDCVFAESQSLGQLELVVVLAIFLVMVVNVNGLRVLLCVVCM